MNGLESQKVMEWRLIHDTSGLFSQGDVTDKSCPAITVSGGGSSFTLETYGSK
jgi:hypothetical protein